MNLKQSYLLLAFLISLLSLPAVAQRGDSYARCFNLSSDNGTTTTCIFQEGTPTDFFF